MNKTKNICIIGCGKIGRKHSSRLSKFSNLYFHSRSRTSATKFNQEFKGRGIFDRFDDVVSSTNIDAVVITSPPEFHKDQIIRSLHAGKPVLVEKPMCVAESEIDDVEQSLAETSGKTFLMVAENYYYKPSLKLIKKLLGERHIGNIQSAWVRKTFQQPASGWKSNYGALIEGGIHFVALISDIFDDAPEKIESSFPGTPKGQVERNSIIKLRYKNGSFAQLTYSWNTASLTKGTFQHSYIIGEKGSICFESNGLYLFIKSGGKTGLYLPSLVDVMGYKAMAEDFMLCLDDDHREPYSDFQKAKRDLSIVFQAYKYLPV